MVSDDFSRLGKGPMASVTRRQFRFIEGLARARDHHATFELRFIWSPPTSPRGAGGHRVVRLPQADAGQVRAHVVGEHGAPHDLADVPVETWAASLSAGGSSAAPPGRTRQPAPRVAKE